MTSAWLPAFTRSQSFGGWSMDIDVSIVRLRRAGRTAALVDIALQKLRQCLDAIRMSRLKIGGFAKVVVQVKQLDVRSTLWRFSGTRHGPASGPPAQRQFVGAFPNGE